MTDPTPKPSAGLVLVVEDEAVVALELEARLLALGYRVAGPAVSFEEAVAAAEREVPDLLLADVRIAGSRDGIDTALELRRRWEVPAVFVTAHSDLRTMQRAVAASPFGYLTKPFRETELRAAVEMAMHRSRLERQLAASEARFRRVVEHISDALMVDDLAGNVVWANARFFELFGIARSQLPGLRLEDYVAPSFRAILRNRHDRRVRGEAVPDTFEYQGQRADGTQPWLEVHVVPVLDERGALIGTQSAIRDVSGRKKADEDLHRVTSQLRGVLRAFPDMLLTLDRDGMVRSILTETHGDLLDEPAELVGEPLESLMPPTFAASARGLLEESFRDRRVVSVLADLAPPFPSQSFEGRFVPMSADEVLLVVRNVTQQREAERALKASEERLRQAQKLDAIGRLAAGIAHDFNNLLTVVVGMGSALEFEVADNAAAVELVRDILGAGERATMLTRQLLAFARLRRSTPGTADTANVLRVFNRVLARLVGEHIEVVEDLDPATWPIHVDVSELEQVVLNLAVNARDAMPAGGRLEIRTKNVVAGAAGNPLPGPAVLLEIADTGSGMDEATLQHVFEPFFTTKDVGQGTGLGLSTVYGIVKQAGGEVMVESEPGRGTRFAIYFPPSGEAAATGRPVRAVVSQAKGEVVLLVEDEPSVRRATCRMLQSAGYDVVETEGPLAALEVVRNGQHVDLLLSDVVMPGMSGPELARSVLALRPALPVLFVSGYAPDERELEGLGDLVLKPFTRDSLAAAVRQKLE